MAGPDGGQEEDQIAAKEIAAEVHIPSNRQSLDYELHPVGKNETVHASSDIVKDQKTGKHYKRVKKPYYSVARNRNAARIDNSHYRGAPIGLGHTLPDTGGGRGYGAHHSAMDDDYSRDEAMLERMRVMMRQEIQNANRQHSNTIKQHIEDAVEKSGNNLDASETGSSDAAMDGKGGKVQTKNGDRDVIDPTSAERGHRSFDNDEEMQFPNPWARIRYKCREPFAEFLACFVLLTFGDGINVQVQLSALVQPTMPKGDYLSISFGWGIAVACAIYVAGGISGGHINPGITLVLACFRGFPWRKVPIYWAAQLAGGVCGALAIYGLYAVPIRMVDPMQTQMTAQFFCTFPATFLEGSARLHAFTAYNEIYATAILVIMVLAIGDSSNAPPTEGMAPIVLLWVVTGIGATLGWQTAYSINPIRDWGPRIALTIVGYEGLWSYQNGYFAYTPLISSMTGALVGAFLYDLFIYDGGESWLNKPWSWNAPAFGASTKQKMPAAINA